MSRRTAFLIVVAAACSSMVVFGLWWARSTTETESPIRVDWTAAIHAAIPQAPHTHELVPYPKVAPHEPALLRKGSARAAFDATPNARWWTPRDTAADLARGASSPEPSVRDERPHVDAAGSALERGYDYGVVAARETILTSGRRIRAPHIYLPRRARRLVTSTETLRARVCVDRSGRPDHVDVVDSTGVPQVDASVETGLADGRYRPLRVGGQLVAFCEPVTVVVEP